MAKASKPDSIILGGGCFWCLEAYFNLIYGITKVTSGYAGGSLPKPTYSQVSSGQSGYAEVIKIEYDKNIIRLDTILTIFWTMHDPTTPNRQGADVGSQYRSVVYAKPSQKTQVINKLNDMQQYWDNRIITQVEDMAEFYEAEEYHQNYFANNPNAAYCQVVINPKLQTLRSKFADLLKYQSY